MYTSEEHMMSKVSSPTSGTATRIDTALISTVIFQWSFNGGSTES